jgi:hypothetical protein
MFLKHKIITLVSSKVIVLILGISLITSVIAVTIKNHQTPSIKTTASQQYDFYVKHDTDFTLSTPYFQNFLTSSNTLTKVRIDTLPNHSTLKLDGVQVKEGQEIDTNQLSKLVLHPYVDEYETYTWSGFDGNGYLPPVSMKVGVGVDAVIAFCAYNTTNPDSGTNSSAITASSICVKPGAVDLYPGDTNLNHDVCSNDNIAATISAPTTPIVQEGVTCTASENSISLGSISTLPVRQNPSGIISDVLIDDLRGQQTSNYTVTAEISDFTDFNNSSNVIALGSNPDGAPATLDPGIVYSINIVDGGSGYTTAPDVIISGGNGTGATAVAEVSGGVITRITVKSYGSGYDYSNYPSVVIVPTNGGSGAIASVNMMGKDSNLNPDTGLPEEKVFVTLDPSIGTISKLKPDLVVAPVGFSTGPAALVTSPTTQHTLFSTLRPVAIGRYGLDDILFTLRTPAYLASGDYRSVITQTIIADTPPPANTPPVVTNFTALAIFGTPSIAFFANDFTNHYTDPDSDSLVSVKILSLPTGGTLKLNGNNINANDIILAADLGNITYIPNNVNDATIYTFNWSANDGTNDSNIAQVEVFLFAPAD